MVFPLRRMPKEMPLPLGNRIPRTLKPIRRWELHRLSCETSNVWHARKHKNAITTLEILVGEKPARITRGGKRSPSGVKLFTLMCHQRQDCSGRPSTSQRDEVQVLLALPIQLQ